MINRQRTIKGLIAILGLLILILDSSSAIKGAQNGITLCIQSVLPSLFPFILLSNVLISSINSSLVTDVGKKNDRRNPVKSKILLTGYLGGYPVGAQCAAQAHRNHQLSLASAQKMAICCNNPGPSFIFGITSSLFPQKWFPWALWGIHILSSLVLFRLIPSDSEVSPPVSLSASSNRTTSLAVTLRSMAFICGWVIIFSIITCIIRRWFLWMLPQVWETVVYGLLEITNGCLALKNINSTGLRFILCALFLSFGGGCTAIQTHTVANGLNCHGYWRCKAFEGGCSLLLAYVIQLVLIPEDQTYHFPISIIVTILAILIIIALSIRKSKNSSRISLTVGV